LAKVLLYNRSLRPVARGWQRVLGLKIALLDNSSLGVADVKIESECEGKPDTLTFMGTSKSALLFNGRKPPNGYRQEVLTN
jgi:hypothetical protein